MVPLRPRPLSLLLLAAGVVAGLPGCGARSGEITLSDAPAAEPSTTSSVPATTAASTTTTTTAARVTTTAAKPRTTTSTAPLPKPVVPKQGDRVFAVFVATGSSLDDPAFSRARSRLAALGYPGRSGGDTACSQGAKEALPQLEEYSLSLEFRTEADAARFAARYGQVIGTAAVNVFCTD